VCVEVTPSPVRSKAAFFVSPSNWIVLKDGSHSVKWPSSPMNLPSGSLNLAVQNRDPLDLTKKEYSLVPMSIVYDTNSHSHALEQINHYTNDSDHNPCSSPPPPLEPPASLQSSPSNSHLRHTRNSNSHHLVHAQKRLPFNQPQPESGVSHTGALQGVMAANEEQHGNFHYTLGNS
jgi:hypothetical protein